MQYPLLAIVGAAAGVFSGFFGLGGAVVVVPALVYFFGMSQHMAQGTSLAMLLPPIGLLAVWRYYQAGQVNLMIAAILALAFFIGAALGAHFAVQVPQLWMKRLFGLVMAGIGIAMVVTGK
jgi:uncharacterized protein